MAIQSLPARNAIREQGNSYVLTVPKDYINTGLLKVGQEYNFTIQIETEEDSI